MSQVKNLRAMFENKGDDTSPPERGRSPAPGLASTVANDSDSPRPLSKVRTNFVAIEKDGKMGLRRDPSHESSPSRRAPSTDVDAQSNSTAAPEDAPKVNRTLFARDPVREPPCSPAVPSKAQPRDGVGALSDKPSVNPDKQLDEEQSTPTLTPANPTEKLSMNEAESAPKVASGGRSKVDKSKDDATTTPTSQPATRKTATTTRSSATSARPTTKAPTKATTTAKNPATATAARQPDPKPVSKAQDKSTTRIAGSSAASKPAASATRTKPAPLKPPQEHNTGFVKPKVKSPTKPVSLPASLMAPTASSVSKGSSSRQTLSRQSGALQPPTGTLSRSPSRASASATGGSAKTIKRQASTINRPRPSIGPPPKKAAQDHPVTKRESHVDEGFLARMMRPTQSSSSKTHDKGPGTPPGRLATRPSTSNTDTSSRRASSAKRQAKSRSPAPEHAISSNASDSAQPPADTVSEIVEAETGGEGVASAQEETPAPEPKSALEPEPAPAPEPVNDTTTEVAEVASPEIPNVSGKGDTDRTQAEEKESQDEPAVEATPEVTSSETIEEISNPTEEAVSTQPPVKPEEPKYDEGTAPEIDEVETSNDSNQNETAAEPKEPEIGKGREPEVDKAEAGKEDPNQAKQDNPAPTIVKPAEPESLGAPAADIVPEQTATVETADAAIERAGEGDLIQTPAKREEPITEEAGADIPVSEVPEMSKDPANVSV